MPIGRKNWLFAGSIAGGERAAAINSVIETAKLNGIEPQAYIADVIEKIASGWPASRWDELMPWSWTANVAPTTMAAQSPRSSRHANDCQWLVHGYAQARPRPCAPST